MWELLLKGGWVLWPILLGSILGVALFTERMWALRRSRIHPPELLRQLLVLIRKGQWREARLTCQAHNNALSRIMWTALTQFEQSQDRTVLKEIVEEAGQREAMILERGVGALGVVASLEPLLGLLGTVLGMIEAFQRVQLAGGGDPRVLAGGVWAALLTTATGLMVAIPAYIAFRFLLARVDHYVLDLQSDVTLLIEALLHESNAPATASKAEEQQA